MNLDDFLQVFLLVDDSQKPVDQIWSRLSELYVHYCSWGSLTPGEFENETLISLLTSYAHKCCSDINPAMEYFFQEAGYETRQLSGGEHQSSEVLVDGAWRYIDADLILNPGASLEELRSSDDEYYRDYIAGFIFTEEEKDQIYQDSSVFEEYPLEVDLAPGESIIYEATQDFKRIVARDLNPGESDVLVNESTEMLGRVILDRNVTTRVGEVVDEAGRTCVQATASSPYVLDTLALYTVSRYPNQV